MRRSFAFVLLVLGILAVACGSAGRPEARTTSDAPPVTPTTAAADTTVSPQAPLAIPAPDQGTWEQWAKTNFVGPAGVAVAPDGGVWTMTSGGLVRWDPDGTYSEFSDPQWPDPAPQSMVFTPNGDLWIGFYLVVVKIEDSGSTFYEFRPTGSDWSPIELDVGVDGAIWVAARQFGIQRFDGDAWEVISDDLPGRGDLDDFAVDAEGRPWVGMYWSGLWVLEPGDWRQEDGRTTRLVRVGGDGDLWYVVDSGTTEDTVVVHVDKVGDTMQYPLGWTSVWEIVSVGDGAYIGTDPFELDGSDRHGLWLLEAGDAEAIEGPWDAFGRQILGVAVDGEGVVWLGGQTGLWRYDGSAARRYLTDTAAGYSVGFLVEGEDGAMWAGDCRNSSIRADGGWRELPEVLDDLSTCDAAVDAEGTHWLAGYAGIAQLEGDDWVIDRADATGRTWIDRYPVCGDGDCDNPTWSLAVVGDQLWAGMSGAEDGLWRHERGAWEHIDGALGPGSGGIVDIVADNDTLWVATSHGVHRHTAEGVWTVWASGADGPPDGLRSLGVGGGIVWAATYGEVARFDGATWTRHVDDISNDIGILTVDSAGAVWRATPDGPGRFDGTDTHRLVLPDARESSYLSLITIGADGTWWMTDGGTIYHWTP